MQTMTRKTLWLPAALCVALTSNSFGEAEAFRLELEVGPTWQSRNDVQIPNDATADRFDLTDVLGSGPAVTFRLNGTWNINERHGLRVVLAPLTIDGTGRFDRDTRVDGETFGAGESLDARYRFDSWRIGYRYRYYVANGWRLWAGTTLKLRDAEIALRQGETRASDDDLGLVPRLHLAGEYRLSDRWHFEFDFDGLAGGPGRAIDLAVKFGYALDDRWRITAGYRGLEGGADTDDVYSFAWLHTGLVGVQYRF